MQAVTSDGGFYGGHCAIYETNTDNECTIDRLHPETSYVVTAKSCAPAEQPFPSLCSDTSKTVVVKTMPSRMFFTDISHPGALAPVEVTE